jgi:high affinity Mn2+ porin
VRRLALLLLWVAAGQSQTALDASSTDAPERWNVYFQATSIGQYHPSFDAPYSGPLSLIRHAEAEASLTSTVFLGYRVARHTELYINPEVAGGRAFSGTVGAADFPNGEMPRVATATPKPYLARLYVTQDFGFGPEQEAMESDENQLAGSRPMTRYSITAGRFTVTDFFDQNRYSHDPRTQFMGWALMVNGAWDYPADTRGYTWGWVHEFHARHWAVRYASVAEPRVANGLRFDRRVLRDRGDTFEGEIRGSVRRHPGAARLLSYFNHADAGSYGEAIAAAIRTGATPDVTAARRPGTLKYGFGINVEQEIVEDIGIFARLGWNDGKTESFAFTPIDRLASGGVSIGGARWHRPSDVAATAIVVSGLSAVHSQYLALGGLDFLLGDGRLRYGPEAASESYYSARVAPRIWVTLDLQRIGNPAYNRDRGPVWVGSLRLHVEAGKK